MAHGLALMRAEVVQDDDVARPEHGNEDLVDVEPERLPVDGPVQQPGRVDPVVPQGGQERPGFPVGMGHLGPPALSAWRPATERGHVGLLPCRPLRPPARHVRAVLLGRDQRLFL